MFLKLCDRWRQFLYFFHCYVFVFLFFRTVVPSCLFVFASRANHLYTFIISYHPHGSKSFFGNLSASNVFLNHLVGDFSNEFLWVCCSVQTHVREHTFLKVWLTFIFLMSYVDILVGPSLCAVIPSCRMLWLSRCSNCRLKTVWSCKTVKHLALLGTV